MFNRNRYLEKLKEKERNGLVKVITGLRRSGKSFLLNRLFYDYLVQERKVDPRHVIRFAFDNQEDILRLDAFGGKDEAAQRRKRGRYVDSRKFLAFINEEAKDGAYYYLLLDEVQNLEEFVRVLNSFLYKGNFDIYVTGSDSRFLSSEVDTEFGGRGDRIHLLPLSFEEFSSSVGGEARAALDEYLRFGGIPLVQLQMNGEEKAAQAISIAKETYLKDIERRHPEASRQMLAETLRVAASMVSTPINPTKIENTFKSIYRLKLSNDTIGNYLSWFEESYLLNKALRYDVKGRQYIGSPYKIYFEDLGIRNAILGFREVDETDLVENAVYNELRYRGFQVDVGIVPTRIKTDKVDKNGKAIYGEKRTEVDFVANKGSKTYYVQAALEIATSEKKEQEYQSIRNIDDSFKKVIVVKNEGKPYYTEEGFLRMSLLDFLSNHDSLDW